MPEDRLVCFKFQGSKLIKSNAIKRRVTEIFCLILDSKPVSFFKPIGFGLLQEQ